MKLHLLLVVATLLATSLLSVTGFAIVTEGVTRSHTLQASKSSSSLSLSSLQQPQSGSDEEEEEENRFPVAAAASHKSAAAAASFSSWWSTATAMVMVNLPVAMAVAAEVVDDDYEYGKVDAPIGIAVAGGLLAILTAAVPVLLRPGEEALEEMRENEGYTFGKDNKDALNRKKK
ncbi:hypothetical protein ACA910_019179 [Epithemia clementina (nom. ined.)]